MNQLILSYIINYPIIVAVLLLLLLHLICRWWLHDVVYDLKVGSVIMAWAMFLWVCLPAYGVADKAMIIPALIILVVWIYILFMYASATLLDGQAYDVRHNLFDLGYWVSGTSLMVVLLDEAEQSLHGIIVFLGLVSIASYVCYSLLLSLWLFKLHNKRFHIHANGMLFLFSISTLSILLLLQEVTTKLPVYVTHFFIFFGVMTYIVALMLVIYHRLCAHRQHLMVAWSNASVLDYGALGLLGVCLIQSSLYPLWMIVGLWWCTIIMMVLTEVTILWNTILHMRHRGFFHAIEQRSYMFWLRIFSLSLFYNFALEYYKLDYGSGWLVGVVVHYGHYFITILLVIQLARIFTYLLRKRIYEEVKS